MKIKRALVNTVCNIGDRLKPVILKIVPLSVSKKIKQRLINSAYDGSAKKPFEKDAYPYGINLIGFIKAQMGLGEGCRLIARATEVTDIPFGIIETRVGNPFNHNDTTFDDRLMKSAQYGINIFHVNPEQMVPLQLSLPADTLDRRYNVGIWLWELEELPDEWLNAFSLVDEVWAPSVFNCESLRRKSPVPVTLIPYGIEPSTDSDKSRGDFGLPDGDFLFLCMYDTNSTIERKNPVGAIRAYKKAFCGNENGVGLVVKVNNPTDEDMARIKSECDGCENVCFISDTLDRPDVNALISCCDVFVSLHRAEGFGLVIAEAMALGTPVIATNWSANVDFMNGENSCPVGYTLVTIEKSCHSYKAGQRWAEPDEDEATEYMKRLFSDREYYDRIRTDAKEYIKENYSVKKSAEAIKNRIDEIYGRRNA